MADRSSPEDFAPPNRRVVDKTGTANQGGDAIEGEIRQFFRREGPIANRQRTELEVSNNPAADDLSAHVQRIAGLSMDEIDRVIRELEGVRDMLQGEGQRISREIAGYSSLGHAAATAMRVIAESIKQWKDGADGSTKIR